MTILVTGGTGLVGERLLPRLVKAGLECRALVRAGKEPPAGGIAIEGDLQDVASLEKAVKGVTAIVHLAAVFRTQDEDLIWRSNLEGTRNLIEATRRSAAGARFIMASTSNVYGATGLHPGREDDLVDPQEAYPASKSAAEKELRDSGLTWAVPRFAFVYGDGDGHIASLPRIAAEGRMKFQPAARMSMIHHRDIAGAIWLALDGRFDGRAVNIADDAPVTIYDLFGIVGDRMQSSSAPLENPWHFQVDNSLARHLGFKPTVRTVFQAAEMGIL